MGKPTFRFKKGSLADLPSDGPIRPVNLLVNFNGGSFLPLVARSLSQSTSNWVTLDTIFNNRSEYPFFSLSDRRNNVHSVLNPRDFGALPAAKLPAEASQFVGIFKESFFASIDRVFLKPLPMSERERLFFQYFHGFANLFGTHLSDRLATRKAFFPSAPHFHWDIAISAALQVTGWEVYSFAQSPFNERLLVRKLDGPQCAAQLEPPPTENRMEKSDPKLQANIAWTKKINSKILSETVSAGQVLTKVVKGIKWVAAPKRFEYFSHSPITGTMYGLQWLWNWLGLRRWLNSYGARSLPGNPFVYFALHLQPERSTVPDAGIFWYQANAISELRRSLPPGVVIVVGEHPRQIGRIGPDLRQRSFRSVGDYETIAAIPNVQMAHWTVTSSVLVENALLTASCTGSVGWDSLRAGKPAVCFGQTWYSSAAACLEWNSGQDFRDRLSGLLQLDKQAIQESVTSLLAGTSRMAWPGLDGSVSEYPSSEFAQTPIDWAKKKEQLALELSSLLEKFTTSHRQKR